MADPPTGIGAWLNSGGFWSSLPRDAVVGAGAGHQILLVVPSLDIVVVRLGQAGSGSSKGRAQARMISSSGRQTVVSRRSSNASVSGRKNAGALIDRPPLCEASPAAPC